MVFISVSILQTINGFANNISTTGNQRDRSSLLSYRTPFDCGGLPRQYSYVHPKSIFTTRRSTRASAKLASFIFNGTCGNSAHRFVTFGVVVLSVVSFYFTLSVVYFSFVSHYIAYRLANEHFHISLRYRSRYYKCGSVTTQLYYLLSETIISP